MKTARAWLVGLLAVCLVGGGAVAALGAAHTFPGFQLFGASSESRTTQIINSVTREEQIDGFNAKVGIDGKNVRIAQTGDKQFVVSVPKFAFIGHSNEHFKVVAENNGVLSWVTQEIDTVEMINNLLNDWGQRKYVDSNEEILKDQTKVFYTGIISSIDPTISLDFEFRS